MQVDLLGVTGCSQSEPGERQARGIMIVFDSFYF